MAGIGERILIQKLCSMSVTEVGIATRQFPRRILARDWIVSAMSASGRTVPLVEGRKRAHRAPAPFRIDWISRQAGILDLEQTGAYTEMVTSLGAHSEGIKVSLALRRAL
jgi:hypothetical protein